MSKPKLRKILLVINSSGRSYRSRSPDKNLINSVNGDLPTNKALSNSSCHLVLISCRKIERD